MLLSNFKPRSALVVHQTEITRPRFPVIDTHNHLFGDWKDRPTSELLEMLDRCGVRGFVSLDGAWGEETTFAEIDKLKSVAPDRFRVFGGIDWGQWPARGEGFIEWAVSRMEEQARRGVDGYKVWKNLGTEFRDQNGQLIAVDDPRMDPLWETAGRLNLPINFHLADPVAFFDPVDEYNERWEELQDNPDWQFPSPPFPSFLSIVEGMATIISRHPETTFIGSHGGCYSENLAWVGALFERCPNFYIDISARLNEYGRQPYSSRRFFLKYADRIFFGLDGYASPENYIPYFRFLETDDEYFPYSPGEIPGQGRWFAYGIYLPDEVLKKVYYENAERVIFNRQK